VKTKYRTGLIFVVGGLALCGRVGAIDCLRATTPAEVTICTDPEVKALDDYLTSAYGKLRTAVNAQMFDGVRRSQLTWIRSRDARCGGNPRCIADATYARAVELLDYYRKLQDTTLPTKSVEPEPGYLGGTTLQGTKLDATEIFRVAEKSTVVLVAFNGALNEIKTGSGVTVAPEVVATNCHVVKGATAVAIGFRGKKYVGRVVAGDTDLDLCILDVPNIPARPAQLANVTNVAPGQRVFAIGAPRGLTNTISEGLVSGIREHPAANAPIIQTSAPISPGSSGGGLYDESGWVIGITTMSLKEAQNINFAVPVELLLRLSEKSAQR
jgi:S1-C subfamily serine protease